MFTRWLILCLLFGSAPPVFSQHLPPHPAIKLAPSLKKHDRNYSTLLLQVSDSAAFFSWVSKEHPGWLLKRQGPKIFTLTNPGPEVIDKLISAKGISYVDQGGRIAREETVLGDFDMTLNAASAVHSLYPSINGEDIIISIKEKPFDINDLDLKGRVTVNDQFDEPSTLHATIMATVAAGAGNTSSFGKGVAPGALVTTSDFERLLPDPPAELHALGVSVQNHSYGVGVENYY